MSVVRRPHHAGGRVLHRAADHLRVAGGRRGHVGGRACERAGKERREDIGRRLLGGGRTTSAARDRDLVDAIRAELAAVEPARACCRAAERAGLGDAATGHARTPVVARLAVRLETGEPDGGFAWAAARDHCRIAWLRGRFLARGSLSLGIGTAHLEFVVDLDEAPDLAARLESLELPPSVQ